jgi:hypothetical protein
MGFRILRTIGLLTLLGLPMRSRKTEVNGMTLMMMGTVTTPNTSMARPYVMPTAVMVARPPRVPPPSTDGVALTATKMDGLTQQTLGLQAQEAVVTHGRWIQLNGMTSMVMDVGTTLEGQPQTFAPIKPAHQSVLPLAVIAGAVLTPMVMVGRTLAMRSSTNRLNGEILMAMVMEIAMRGTRAMHAQKCVALPCLTVLVAETLMETVGLIQLRRGKLTLKGQRTLSQQKPCNGETSTGMDSVMCHLVPSEMTARIRLVLPSAMCKGALIQTTTVGQTRMENSPQLWPSSVRTLKPLG